MPKALIAVFGCNFLADAIQTSPMVRITEPAQRETEIWRQIRFTESSLRDLREWDAFCKGVCFAGEEVPVSIRQENVEFIDMLLTQHLVELKKAV